MLYQAIAVFTVGFIGYKLLQKTDMQIQNDLLSLNYNQKNITKSLLNIQNQIETLEESQLCTKKIEESDKFQKDLDEIRDKIWTLECTVDHLKLVLDSESKKEILYRDIKDDVSRIHQRIDHITNVITKLADTAHTAHKAEPTMAMDLN